MLVLADALKDCYADAYQKDVPGHDNHRTFPKLER
jgi:hypothetical protein